MSTPDALRQHWVERAPPRWQPYLRLARFDRPIGSWLLYWPCVWGVMLAPGETDLLSRLLLCLLFYAGAVAMRGAGCVWNDIVDADLDARVERTRGRPIPSGAASKRQALAFMLLLCGVGLAVLLLLPRFAQLVALASIPLVALYPLMKRISWWPQAWLGLTFNWGALVGYAAIAGRIESPALLLYVAGIFWTLGYDSIYAAQDMEDDALAGIKSSARALGDRLAPAVLLFYLLTMVLLGAAAWRVFGSAALLLLATGLHPGWQWLRLRGQLPVLPPLALALFRSNARFGMLVAAALFFLRVAQPN